MTVDLVADPQSEIPDLTTATEYLGLNPDQRYAVSMQHFPPWLLEEPVAFPARHPTFGWACRVRECRGALQRTHLRNLCSTHRKEYVETRGSVSFDEFVNQAVPIPAVHVGWALQRRVHCMIPGCPREVQRHGYCMAHADRLQRARAKGVAEAQWRASALPFPPKQQCIVPRCVHDGELNALASGQRYLLCRAHLRAWHDWLDSVGQQRSTTSEVWKAWLDKTEASVAMAGTTRRGEVALAALPHGLQQEVRYAIHRHANTARRTQWVPNLVQQVVDILKNAGINTLADDSVDQLADELECSRLREMVRAMRFAARSLVLTDDVAKNAGWFDPRLVGATQFPRSETRRIPWDLTGISQRWLRDLMWEHLRDEASQPAGKRPCADTIRIRLTAVHLLSDNLRNNRADHGEHPERLGAADGRAVKDTWNIWFQEQCPIPRMCDEKRKTPPVLTGNNRARFSQGLMIVLRASQAKGRTPEAMDSFILALPEYARPKRNPRPRPLSYRDFQLLVDPKSIEALEAMDTYDVGYADIWLTQAFQGGRIGETLNLRLGCVGLIGNAQPYIWRDISKIDFVDYGMPCYLPVYERLLGRQEKTRTKLRSRYAEQLAALDDRGRLLLEAEWDRVMPIFPGPQQNPDLVLALSACWFRTAWTKWFETLGLSGLTTHQTRATLATSLLNNGAPAALVSQLLGHSSAESLAFYANYNDASMSRYLRQVWAAGPAMDKPGTILLRPADLKADNNVAAADRIDLTVIPVEHGLCRYGPVVGGAQCPFEKNCTAGPLGPCEHFVLTGADLAYWERKRDAAFHFAEGAPNDEARDYIVDQWTPWEPVIANLREALSELGLLEEAEQVDLRTPLHDYFDPVFSAAWSWRQLCDRDSQSKDHEDLSDDD